MTPVLVIAVGIGLVSFMAAAFLLSLWHEDQASGTQGWPLSRVLAYLAIVGTLAANLIGAVALLRLADVPNFRELQLALSPMTLGAILILDLLFPVLALYLRAVRATGYISPTVLPLLATEASVQEAIKAAKAAFQEANHVNNKIAMLTEALGHKEDKP